MIKMRPSIWPSINQRNPLAEDILELAQAAKQTQTNSGERQLALAIRGDCPQCDYCSKYFTDKKQRNRHRKTCEASHHLRYRFARIDARYFCYQGCKTFADSGPLIDHLLEAHEGELHAWGMDAGLLRAQARGNFSQADLDAADIAEAMSSSEEEKEPSVDLADLLEEVAKPPTPTLQEQVQQLVKPPPTPIKVVAKQETEAELEKIRQIPRKRRVEEQDKIEKPGPKPEPESAAAGGSSSSESMEGPHEHPLTAELCRRCEQKWLDRPVDHSFAGEEARQLHKVYWRKKDETMVAHVTTWRGERKRVALSTLAKAPAVVFVRFMQDLLDEDVAQLMRKAAAKKKVKFAD